MLLSGNGRETLETIEGRETLRKVIRDKHPDNTINIDYTNWDDTIYGLNKYIQNADKKELVGFYMDFCKEANSIASDYARRR